MESLLAMNMNSNGNATCSRRDLENLLTILDTAEEVATMAPSATYLGRDTDANVPTFSLLEPTPFRPDRDMVLQHQQQQFFLKQERSRHQMLFPPPKIPYLVCASGGSSFTDLFAGMDDEPLNLEEAIMAPVISGNMAKDFLSAPKTCSLNMNTNVVPFADSSSFSEMNDESAPIRFRKYQTSQWDDRFQELLLFRQEHGHLLVPHSYPPNQKLAQWVKRQRHQSKRKKMGHHSTLTNEREEQLLDVGFIFDSHRAVWYARFETLKAFSLANGHCGIPSKFDDGSLNVWIKHQRRQYLLFKKGDKSTMTDERIAALDSIGFDWNPRNLFRAGKF